MSSANKKVKFQTVCPSGCICGSKETRNWRHQSCGTQSYMNNQGDISCENGCGQFFIQNCAFRCQQSQDYEKHRNASQFVMGLSISIQSSELNNSGQDLLEFITILSTNICNRWQR